jgi:DNA-binding transcriptional MerR regulator
VRNSDREELLSTKDAGEILNLTPDGVRYLERRGKLRAQYLRSGQRVFRLEDVETLRNARAAAAFGGELEELA